MAKANAKPSARTKPIRLNGSAPPARRDREDELGTLAARGKLAEAGRAAARNDLAAGLPVTYKRGNDVLREYPDGRVVVIGTIEPAVGHKLPKRLGRVAGS